MKKKVGLIFAVVLVVAGATALGFMGYSLAKIIISETTGNQARAEVVGEAPKDSFEGLESFTVGNPGFDVGTNIYGKVIFVDSTAALNEVKEKCAQAIEEMRNQAPELGRFREGNIYGYYDYIWQINWNDVDKDVLKQKQFLSQFLAYYENGDPKQGSDT